MSDLRTFQNKIVVSPTPLEEHQLEDLKHLVRHALHIMRKTQRERRYKLFSYQNKKNPWILLLGPAGSGKTSLLKHAGLNLISANNKTLDLIKSTKNIDWWIGQDIVFIDTAAEYTENPAYWHAFVKLLTKKLRRPLDSLCLTIDLPRLAEAEESVIAELQKQLKTIAGFQSPLSVNLVITKSDQIRGFAEFFNSLSPEEQQQPCGFSIIDPNNIQHYSQSFPLQFKQFTKLINTKLLERLHHEPNLERRQRLSDFPLQLERLLPALNKLVDSFEDSSRIVLNSLFFCSTQQSLETLDFLADDLSRSFDLHRRQQTPMVANQRALFIPGMIREICQPSKRETTSAQNSRHPWWQLTAYPLTLGVILCAAYFLHKSYHANSLTIKAGSNALTLTNNQGLLPNLDQLYKLKQELGSTKPSLSFNTSHKLKAEVNQAYNTALQKQFEPYLQNSLRLLAREQITQSSPALYNTLETYLMFTMPDRMHAEFVKHWFANYWQQQLKNNPAYQQQLQLYLTDYISLHPKAWTQDQPLVTQAQEILQQQPLAQLAFRMLQNNFSQTDTPIQSSLNIDGVDLSQAILPNFYQTESFAKIYNQEIPKLANAYLNGNWVIGKNTSSTADLNSLTKDLRQLYVNAYLAAWQDGLAKIKFLVPKSYDEAINQINLLTSSESPLWHLYTNSIDVARKAGANIEVDRFLNSNALSDYLPGQTKAPILVTTLQNLQNYLKKINDAPSQQKAAFDQAAKRFNQTQNQENPLDAALQKAGSLPQPLQDWQQQIASSSWQLILNDARVYISTLWKTTVVPDYNNSIKDRYPIFASASNDIRREDFNHFFGPGGIIQKFFKTIEPFVNMSQTYWTWKQIDGTTLNISQASLDMLIRASMIQKMFYTNNPDKPTLRFKLTPVEVSDNTNQFALNIGGQMIRYLPGLQKTTEASWPGTDGDFVTLQFNSAPNNSTITTTGEWAWQKILGKATLQSTSDPQHYQVTFKLDNHQAVFDLIADNPINPYLPNILTGFRIPADF